MEEGWKGAQRGPGAAGSLEGRGGPRPLGPVRNAGVGGVFGFGWSPALCPGARGSLSFLRPFPGLVALVARGVFPSVCLPVSSRVLLPARKR